MIELVLVFDFVPYNELFSIIITLMCYFLKRVSVSLNSVPFLMINKALVFFYLQTLFTFFLFLNYWKWSKIDVNVAHTTDDNEKVEGTFTTTASNYFSKFFFPLLALQRFFWNCVAEIKKKKMKGSYCHEEHYKETKNDNLM